MASNLISVAEVYNNMLITEKKCDQIVDARIREIDIGLMNIEEQIQISKFSVENFFKDIILDIDNFKNSILKELDVALDMQINVLKFLKTKLQEDQAVLSNALFVGQARHLNCFSHTERNEIVHAFAQKIMPIFYSIMKCEAIETIPIEFIPNEDMCKMLKEKAYFGMLNMCSVDVSRIRLIHEEGKYVGKLAIFKVRTDDIRYISRFSKYFRWKVEVCDEEIATKKWVINGIFGFEFMIETPETYVVSFFILNQHISGSPYKLEAHSESPSPIFDLETPHLLWPHPESPSFLRSQPDGSSLLGPGSWSTSLLGPNSGSPHLLRPNSESPHLLGSNSENFQMLEYNSESKHLLESNSGSPQIPGPNSGSSHLLESNSGNPYHQQRPNSGNPRMLGLNSGSLHLLEPNSGSPRLLGPNCGSPHLLGSNSESLFQLGSNSRGPYLMGRNSGSPHLLGLNSGSHHLIGSNYGSSYKLGPNSGSSYKLGLNSESPHLLGPNSNSPHLLESNSGSPHLLDSNSGSPHLLGHKSESPLQLGSNSISPHLMGQNSGSPHLLGPNYGSPHQMGSNSESPYKLGSNSGSPHLLGPNSEGSHMLGHNSVSSNQLGSNSGSPYKLGSNSESPYKLGSNSGSPHLLLGPNSGIPHLFGPNSVSPNQLGSNSGSPHLQEPNSGSPHPLRSNSGSPHLPIQNSGNPYQLESNSESPYKLGPHSPPFKDSNQNDFPVTPKSTLMQDTYTPIIQEINIEPMKAEWNLSEAPSLYPDATSVSFESLRRERLQSDSGGRTTRTITIKLGAPLRRPYIKEEDAAQIKETMNSYSSGTLKNSSVLFDKSFSNGEQRQEEENGHFENNFVLPVEKESNFRRCSLLDYYDGDKLMDDERNLNNKTSFEGGKRLVAKCEFVAGFSEVEMCKPIGVAQLQSKEIVVADTFANRMILFSQNGKFIREFGSRTLLQQPSAVTVLPNGNFAVRNSCEIIMFSPSCSYLFSIGSDYLRKPHGIASDSLGNLYTVDTGLVEGEVMIVKMNSKTGNLMQRREVHLASKDLLKESKPRFIAFQEPSTLLIVDIGLNNVSMAEVNSGRVLKCFGKGGHQDGEFIAPSGVTCGEDGFILVADSKNHRIQIFTPNGDFVTILRIDRPLTRPSGISLTPEGNLLVLNYWENTLVKYKLHLQKDQV